MATEKREEIKGEVLDTEPAYRKFRRFNTSVARRLRTVPHLTTVGRTNEFGRVNFKLKREVSAENIRTVAIAHNLDINITPNNFSWISPRESMEGYSPWSIGIGQGTHPRVEVSYRIGKTDEAKLDVDKVHRFLSELSKTSKKAKAIDVAKKVWQEAKKKLRGKKSSKK